LPLAAHAGLDVADAEVLARYTHAQA
jgi:hypothetical protein